MVNFTMATHQPFQVPLASPSSYWFALRVRSNFEETSYKSLCGAGLEAFLPGVKILRRWSDRVKVVNKPLFPGYVFSRFDPTQRADILRTPGVVHIINSSGVPLPIPESELNYIRTVILADLESAPHPFIRVGERMRIVHGPLVGAEGVITTANGSTALILSISLLQRSIAVKVEPDWLQPV